jgi:hypothetical protein
MATTYTLIAKLSYEIKNTLRMSVFTFFGNPGFGAARLRQFLLSQSRLLSAAAASLVDPFRISDTRILDRNCFQRIKNRKSLDACNTNLQRTLFLSEPLTA